MERSGLVSRMDTLLLYGGNMDGAISLNKYVLRFPEAYVKLPVLFATLAMRRDGKQLLLSVKAINANCVVSKPESFSINAVIYAVNRQNSQSPASSRKH